MRQTKTTSCNATSSTSWLAHSITLYGKLLFRSLNSLRFFIYVALILSYSFKEKIRQSESAMVKFYDDKNNRPNVGKQNKQKMIIIYKKIQIKVRIPKLNWKTGKLSETLGDFEKWSKRKEEEWPSLSEKGQIQRVKIRLHFHTDKLPFNNGLLCLRRTPTL